MQALDFLFLGQVAFNQALGQAAGIVNTVALVIVFAALTGACVAALSERHTGMVKHALVIAAVAGLAWTITKTCFQAGGQQTNTQLQQVN